jgi:bifunctional non-homologous end joining protein LigD
MPRSRAVTFDAADYRPMLATLGNVPLDDKRFVYEPKYDGIRAIVTIEPHATKPLVRLWSRLGNEKTAQFPEIVRAVERFAAPLDRALVLDGEIVALDAEGRPVGFQHLQGRIHTMEAVVGEPVAMIFFDVLRDGDEDLQSRPLSERRARLEQLLRRHRPDAGMLRISTQAGGDGRRLWLQAQETGWEGLIAKRADSVYRAGRRSPEWVKLKLVLTQEFVVGGWTEPRGTRSLFGALLLGVYDESGKLEYVGHTGAGFNERELQKVARLLKPLQASHSPFRVQPKPNERPHWVRPELVVEVKFTEWTSDNKLRHPTYLGLRDDVVPTRVRRETSATRQSPVAARRTAPRASIASTSPKAVARAGKASASRKSPGTSGTRTADGSSRARSSAARRNSAQPRPAATSLQPLLDQLNEIESGRGSGRILLPDGFTLDVTNLRKVFWPQDRITKGELLRYYVQVAPALLPVVADRPLVMKRFPNGIEGQAFYQQRAPDKPPAGIRVETLEGDDVPSRLVGGSLETLLYMTQLAVVSQDPWFSTVQAPTTPDAVAIDLDPMPDVSFDMVLDVARWVHDELEALGSPGFPKTSGSDGLHIFIPMPPGTPYEAGMIFCQIVASIVSAKHPKQATVERTVRARGPKVYVDCLQNIEGKTLACAYSARASEFAGASTPLTWKEVHQGVDRRDFTIRTLPDRLGRVGDLWERLRRSKPADLHAVERYISRQAKR